MSDEELNVKISVDSSNAVQGFNVVSSASKGFNQSLMADMSASGESVKKLSLATAGATREIIVLGHEVLTGNFSRIPGSMMVLAERTGGLGSVLGGVTAATVGWAAAIGATVFAIYEMVEASSKLEETQNNIAAAMFASGHGLEYNSEGIKQNIDKMRELQAISNSEAQSISETFARTRILPETQAQLENFITTWKQLTDAKDNEAAAKDMAKVFSEPSKYIDELAQKYPGIINAQEVLKIKADEAANGAQHAGQVFINDVGPALIKFGKDFVEPQIGLWEKFKQTLVSIQSLAPTEAVRGGGVQGDNAEAAASKAALAAALEKEQAEGAINQAELRGLAIVNETKGAQTQLNKLLSQQAELVKDINVAGGAGHDDLVVKYQETLRDVNAKIEQENKRLNAADVAAAKAALQEKISIAREDATTARQLGNIKLQDTKTTLDMEVAAGHMSIQEELNQRIALAQKEYEIQKDSLNKELQIKGLSLQQQHGIDNQLIILEAQTQEKIHQIQKDAAKKQEESWREVNTNIANSFTSSLNGMLQHTTNFKQGAAQLFDQLALNAIDSFVKTKIMNGLAQLEMTGAHIAGDQARVASTAAAAVEGGAVQTAAAQSAIGKDAYTAAAGAYQSAAQIPYVGWIIAPIAAAAAFVAVEGFGGGFSAEGGFDIPSGVNPKTQLHEREMVLPAHLADNVRNMSGNGNSGSNITINLNAIDSQSGAQFLKSNGPAIAQAISSQMRNNNGSLNKAMRQ